MTQKEKIVTLMCRQPDRWWFVYDFMQTNLGTLFVGYKAESRISELNADYPQMFNREVAGKYVKRRINRFCIQDWFASLPKELRQIVAKELNYYPHIPKTVIKETPHEPTAKENGTLFSIEEVAKATAKQSNGFDADKPHGRWK